MVYPYEDFITGEDYETPPSIKTKEDFYSKVCQYYPADDETEITNDLIMAFVLTNTKKLTELFNKSDVILLADSFEKIIKVAFRVYGSVLFILFHYLVIRGNVV